MTDTGKLYVVGTPIGNLSDFSPRGIETLSAVDYIARTPGSRCDCSPTSG